MSQQTQEQLKLSAEKQLAAQIEAKAEAEARRTAAAAEEADQRCFRQAAEDAQAAVQEQLDSIAGQQARLQLEWSRSSAEVCPISRPMHSHASSSWSNWSRRLHAGPQARPPLPPRGALSAGADS